MKPSRLALAFALTASAPLALAAQALALPGCQDTTSEAKEAETIKVSGSKCAYDYGPRPEYTKVFFIKTADDEAKVTTAPQPNIQRVRLGLGGSLDASSATRVDASKTVVVAWQTELGTNASTVQYGKDPDPSKWRSEDVSQGFSYVVPAGENAISGSDQQLHEVHVCGLEANTTYYYRAGGGPKGGEVWSDVLSFTTAPSDASSEVKIAVTGDSRGQHDNAWQLLQERLYRRGDVRLQLFSGDMVDLATNQKEYENWLDNAYVDTIGKHSTFGQLLTLSAMGNHDNYNIQYYATVVQPQDKKYDKYQELFFSVDVGPVHVVVLDDYAIAKPTIDQDYGATVKTWLDADLSAVDRKLHPWVIAVHHHPEWSSSNHGMEKDVVNVRNFLSPIWDAHRVNMVFTGHDHNYERSKPLTINDGQPNVGQGTTYIVCAGSGAEGYSNGSGPTTAQSFKYDGSNYIGVYGLLSATRDKLSFEAFGLSASGMDESIDQVSLP